ncbi:MAG: inositol monophosphatase [Candidatus Omnitrophica bacterium]|nr:inositol monophosphatase [Candidatus Omnitrophota bacterium]
MTRRVKSPTRAQLTGVLKSCLADAGSLLASSLHRLKRIDYKSEANLVTNIDQEAERRILRRINRHFPGHAILAEESSPKAGSRYKWIIDPLDGTTNFAHTFPVACVSIAVEEDGEVILGGVFDPFRNELFFGERGRGATLNGKKISVSKADTLRESLLCTGFPYDRKIFASTYLAIFGAFMTGCHGIRRTGSAAIDICYVACGRFDGFWELKLNAWDTAAASLICSEAGGRLSNFTGHAYSIYEPEALASNGRIHSEMLKVLKRHYVRPESRAKNPARNR